MKRPRPDGRGLRKRGSPRIASEARDGEPPAPGIREEDRGGEAVLRKRDDRIDGCVALWRGEREDIGRRDRSIAAGHDSTTTREDRVDTTRSDDQALDVDMEPAVGEELHVALTDAPRDAATGDAIQDEAAGRESRHRRVEDLAATGRDGPDGRQNEQDRGADDERGAKGSSHGDLQLGSQLPAPTLLASTTQSATRIPPGGAADKACGEFAPSVSAALEVALALPVVDD